MKEFVNQPNNTTSVKSKQEEKESRIPDYTIQIYFSGHGSSEDIAGATNTRQSSPEKFKRKGLADLFKKADIYVPELYGWTESALRQLQDLSYGRITPEQVLTEISSHIKSHIADVIERNNFDMEREDPMYSFKKSELEMIYQSYKPIIIFDIPEGHPKSGILRGDQYTRPTGEISQLDTFEKTLSFIRESLKKTANSHNEREDYMLSQINPKLEEVFKQRPDLRNKSDLQVLMFLGALHTRVAHTLKQYGVKIKSHNSRSPQIFGFNNEAHRRLAFGMEVNNELAAQVLLEELCLEVLGGIILNLTKDHNEVTAFVRKIVNRFTYDEIKELYEIGMPGAIVKFLSYLNEKNINPPTNHSDLMSFIS